MEVRKILFAVLLAISVASLVVYAQTSSSPKPNAAESGKYAKEINPDSLNRLPMIKRDDLGEAGKKQYDAIASDPSQWTWLQAATEIRLHGGGEDVRYESPLGHRLTELAIISSAREMDQPFEWTLHAEEALRQGLERPIVELVRDRKPLDALGEKESVIVELGREVEGKHKLSSETFARALKVLGEHDLVDIVTLQGHYVGSAVRLTEVDQHLPLDWKFVIPLTLPYTETEANPDVYPDSRSRLPEIKPQAPRGGGAGRAQLAPTGTGPTEIGLHAGSTKMLEADIGKRLMDVAMLIVAREWNQQFQWTVHEVEARKDGLEQNVIDVISDRKPLTSLGEKEAAIIELGREEFEDHRVKPETYARAVKLFGERDTVDLGGLMADTGDDAAVLTAFDQQLPASQKPLLPPR